MARTIAPKTASAPGITAPTAGGASWPLHVAVPVVVFVVVVTLGLWADPFQYDTDEGLNLMKAALVAGGHPLYRDIWSDQPPLHTLILAGVFEMTGPNASAGRVLTAAFSALLVASLFDAVSRTISTRAGLIAAGLLVAATWYPKLSFSVMIGLPAMALAMASLALSIRSVEASRDAWASWGLLALSALLMAAAVGVKLVAVMAIAPGVLLLYMLLARQGEPPPDVAGRVFAWLLLILACDAAVVLITQPSLGDLVGTHVAASRQYPWRHVPSAQRLMRQDWDLLALTLVSLGMWTFAVGRLRRDALVPGFWFVSSAAMLQLHEPIWYHHSLLLVVPAAWASAAVIEDTLRLRVRLGEAGAGGRARVLALLLVGLITWEGVKLTMSVRRMFVPNGRKGRQVVAEMSRYAPQTTWVFADRLIYPFAAGLLVPPEVAVVSTKRRQAGKLSDEQVVGVLERYRPEQIVLARMEFGPKVMAHVREHYRPGDRGDAGRAAKLYLRADLATVSVDGCVRSLHTLPPSE